MLTPVLKLPDMSKPFVLQSDAGVGEVLQQGEDGVKRPVFYASQKLKSHQLSYSLIEKECKSIVWAVQKFQRYLHGKEFLLNTDHQPLIYHSYAKVSDAH